MRTPLAHPAPMQPRVLRQLQQQREDVLRHGRRAVAGDIGDRNAARGGGGGVHDIEAGGEHAEVAQRRGLRDGGGVHGRFIREHEVRAGYALGHGVGGCAVMDGERAERGECAPVEVAGIQREAVEDDDLRLGNRRVQRGWSPSFFISARSMRSMRSFSSGSRVRIRSKSA